MIVVSDTTPLISLLKIERLDLLKKLFGNVLIPQAVYEELTVDERFSMEAEQLRQKDFPKTYDTIFFTRYRTSPSKISTTFQLQVWSHV